MSKTYRALRRREKRPLNRRAIIAERAENQRKARETAECLLWAKAVIDRNQRLGLSVGC